MSNTTAPKIDENQEMNRKNKSAPINTKPKNIPALTFDDQNNEILDIEYKVIREDPVEES